MKNYLIPSLLAGSMLFVAACQPAPPQAAAPAAPTATPTQSAGAAMAKADIVDTAVAAGSFTTLVAAVEAAGLVETLKGEGPFTVFAPTDDAFAALPAGTVDELLKDPKGPLSQILLYHVVPGKVMAADVTDGLEAATAQGANVAFSVKDGSVMINGAKIVTTDIEASNGVIHVIDAVIMPPAAAAEAPAAAAEMADIVDTAVAAGSFTTLVAAVEAAGLVETLKGEGPFTVFAPTDDAFAALPAGTVDELLKDPTGPLSQILLYHVVPGKVMAADVTDGLEAATAQGANVTFSVKDGTVMINGAKIVTTDIGASNGVIHVIDAVIMPPEAAAETPAEMADIVDTAVAAGSFTTLVAAVEAAGLVETLKGEGPFTVFAPTDDAFAALPAGTLDELLKDPQGQLSQILLYHVVAGKVMAADVLGMDGKTAETAGGKMLNIKIDGDKVMINDAVVVTTDIETSNGVIHVIDTVLVPAE